jgi:negative regulator of flagellin synthesis FlgM
MKINHPGDPIKLDRATVKANGNGAAKAPATAPAASTETLSLSELSTHLSKLETHLATSGEFDAGKVETIKQAIRDGHFKINSEVVADKLIKSAKELLGK